jgi:SAM-dependent methyltransferase
MKKYLKNNLAHWNELAPINVKSDSYNLSGFKKGKSSLKPIEIEEVGNVSGKKLLHLQCHFGMDSMSWARQGAKVVGVDFSPKAIELAKAISKELKIDCRFICCNIYDLPNFLKEKFDIVFTSYGVLCWLPDLKKWGKLISHFLKPGGSFHLLETHPFNYVFDNERETKKLIVKFSYFHSPQPMKWENETAYADPKVKVKKPSYEWTHSLGDIINALIQAGLKIEYLHEFPFCFHDHYSFMHKGKDGYWRLKGKKETIPLMFSLKATKTK